jgi:signal transduction histidine kinase
MIPAALLNMPDMTIHEVNQAFFKLYEYDDSCVEMRADQIFGQAAAGDIASHMLKNESFKLAAVEQKKADGTKFIANITGKPVSLDDKTQSVLMDIQDITEQIRIAEMEKELQQKLIQANKMTSLGTLVSGVAHEINNPNNFIMFNNSLLMEFAEDAFSSMEKHYSDDDVIGGLSFAEFKQDIRKLIEGIENGSQRIKNIVHDLKGFTKKSDNEDFDSVNMENVISTSLRILNHQITNKTENFALDIQTPLPMVRGITQKLEQVFINIVMNALEAISGKSSMVKVESYQQDKKLIIKVTDEGLGISPENLSRITEPFFTTKQQDGGTGLGLSIVYSILDQHNGYMDIESEVGKGTTVTVSLPAEDKV